MYKKFDFGYPCHIPSICEHNVFIKDIFVIYMTNNPGKRCKRVQDSRCGISRINILSIVVSTGYA